MKLTSLLCLTSGVSSIQLGHKINHELIESFGMRDYDDPTQEAADFKIILNNIIEDDDSNSSSRDDIDGVLLPRELKKYEPDRVA